VILTGIADRLTEEPFSLLLFYLVPVGLVSWFGGAGPGVAISALAAVVWFLSSISRPDTVFDVTLGWNTLEKFGIFLVVSYVVSMQAALRVLLEREKELSGTDPLTGLMNRRAFNEQVEKEIVRSRRYGHPFSVAYMDLDDFKEVNDRGGHAAGDLLLLFVAMTLHGSLRSSDFLARLGGDEFAVLLPETGPAAAVAVMGKALERLSRIQRSGEDALSASIGLLTCENPPESRDRLLRSADELMYSAKKEGKNRIRHEVT
jgi:diguanylate cyclase (GGDEF)-like protein